MNSKSEKAPIILADKTPKVSYNKRYDQVSWRSADTDFETDPSTAGIEYLPKGKAKVASFCTRRNRKLTALIIVVIVFLIIMAALIYLYYSKPGARVSTLPVITDCGKVTGTILSISDSSVNVFKGIPYAVPPIGHLRWSAPIPLSEDKSNCWLGVFEATHFGPECAQGRGKGSEDCLYLNVYTPQLNPDANLTVFVWLHGGYLMDGSGNEIGYSPNTEFALSMNSVVVTINYRLNAFGFLTLKELWQKDKSYGNYGIMDQILALKWVQRNIRNFGGNPKSVTVAGHNAGGSSVFALLVSPLAVGLFQKAISMSGFPQIYKPYSNASSENRLFINRTRCVNSTSHNMRGCLYNLTTHEVLTAIPYFMYPFWGFIKENLLDFPSKGAVDPGLIVIDPLVVVLPPIDINSISFAIKNKISVLIGTTAQEIGVSPVVKFDGTDQWPIYEKYLKKRLDPFSPNFTKIVLHSLYNNKTNEGRFSTEYLHETVTTDVRVTCPTNRLTKSIASSLKHRVYRYVVTHRPISPIRIFKYPAKFAFHMWDKIALFNFNMVQLSNYTPSATDLVFQRSLRDNFKHFMLYGHVENSDWTPGTTGVFGKDGTVAVFPEGYHKEQCLFWNDPSNGFLPYAWSI